MEFPRADHAVITDAATGEQREVSSGKRADALFYELSDMESAVSDGDASGMMLQYTEDVMDIMTSLRAEWGLTYPEEDVERGARHALRGRQLAAECQQGVSHL